MVDRTSLFQELVSERCKVSGKPPPVLSATHIEVGKDAFLRAANAVHVAIKHAALFIKSKRTGLSMISRSAAEHTSAADAEADVQSTLKRCGQQVDDFQKAFESVITEATDFDRHSMFRGMLACLYLRLQDLSESFLRLKSARQRREESIADALGFDSRSRILLTASTHAVPDMVSPRRTPTETQALVTEGNVLEQENIALKRALQDDAEALERAEQSLRDIAELQSRFAACVEQQSERIDLLYDESVKASFNVQRGSEFLESAKNRAANSRVVILSILLMMTFALVFLDWYMP
eukprot:TRINITY_DN13441_c0_g1_i1.p1 TRINITY_DN13441_c0_g1~~TRINITY_DN13441_c0_g1_i1.p1  ORF type:complete len:294 (-),score=58.54 TRINITY_DN13441_c0_g1_i1:221-1102(-)